MLDQIYESLSTIGHLETTKEGGVYGWERWKGNHVCNHVRTPPIFLLCVWVH